MAERAAGAVCASRSNLRDLADFQPDLADFPQIYLIWPEKSVHLFLGQGTSGIFTIKQRPTLFDSRIPPIASRSIGKIFVDSG